MKRKFKIAVLLTMVLFLAFILSCESFKAPTSETLDNQTCSENLTTPNSRDIGPTIVDPEVDPCGEIKTVELWPSPCVDTGSVTIYNDDVNLYVTVYSIYGYQNVEDQIKIWVGTDLTMIPGGGETIPPVELFPYQYTVDSTATVLTAVIPLDEIQFLIDCDEQIYVVVYSDLLIEDGYGGTLEVSGWAGDMAGNGNTWWVYTTYEVQCCPIFDICETAFGKGGWVFASSPRANPENLPSLNLTRQNWGWAVNIDGNGDHIYDIWAGAGKNDVSKGTLVGTLIVSTFGDQVDVTYMLDPGYFMYEVHIYAGDFAPTTIAPGQFGHTVEFENGASSYSHTFTIEDTDDDGIWIIAHAVVCWEEGVMPMAPLQLPSY